MKPTIITPNAIRPLKTIALASRQELHCSQIILLGVRNLDGNHCSLRANYQLCNRLQLHIGSALVDRANLRIAPEFLDWIILDVAIAAVKLDRFRGDAFGCPR